MLDLDRLTVLMAVRLDAMAEHDVPVTFLAVFEEEPRYVLGVGPAHDTADEIARRYVHALRADASRRPELVGMLLHGIGTDTENPDAEPFVVGTLTAATPAGPLHALWRATDDAPQWSTNPADGPQDDPTASDLAAAAAVILTYYAPERAR